MKKRKLEEYLYENFARSTVETYQRHIEEFLRSNKGAEKFGYKDIVSFMAGVQKKYDSSPTCKIILCAIKEYYEFLIESGNRNDHPCKYLDVKVKRRKGVIHSNLFSSEELEILYRVEARYKGLDERNKVLISFLIYQGLTLDELERLEVKNINLDKGEVYIKKGKKNNSRKLKLQPQQVKMIVDYLPIREKLLKVETDALLVGMRGTPVLKDSINGFIENLKPMFPDKNLNPTTIRQSVIANWINEKKIPLEDVQLLAGHKWLSSTQEYVNHNTSKEQEMINKFHPLNVNLV